VSNNTDANASQYMFDDFARSSSLGFKFIGFSNTNVELGAIGTLFSIRRNVVVVASYTLNVTVVPVRSLVLEKYNPWITTLRVPGAFAVYTVVSVVVNARCALRNVLGIY
jgi:hypothetical protein